MELYAETWFTNLSTPEGTNNLLFMTVLAQALKHFSFSIERMKTYKMHQNARIKSAVH